MEKSQKTVLDCVMTAQDPRREILKELELLEYEAVLKMNRDFSTMIDSYIAEGNYKNVQVFS